MSGVRLPAVAGQFYEGGKDALAASIERCFLHPLGPGALPRAASREQGRIDALVSPHAGYMYSGPAAAHGYRALAEDGVPDTVIIVGPSHYTLAERAALSLADAWRTPLGDAQLDTDLGHELTLSPLFEVDEKAHRDEHSLEVQVPFLQFIYGERMPRILPICVRSHPMNGGAGLVANARAAGEAIAAAVGSRRTVVVASTDFSHQVPQEVAQKRDRLALDAIASMDAQRLLETVRKHDITMCGPVPVAVALFYCLARGADNTKVLTYYTSGDIIGDRRAVVGYASAKVGRGGDGA